MHDQLGNNTMLLEYVSIRLLLAMAVCCFFLQSFEGTRVAFEVTSVEIT